MIRYFTNYSYGGYEELYLGNSEDKEDYRYHLPLLQSKRAKLADDPTNKKLADDVERLSQYVLIQKNGVTPIGTLPEGSFTIISNPGYKTICRRLGNQFVVAISDVASEDHDEMGSGMRENPFTMLFVFDIDDANLMDVFLFQLLEKEEKWRSFISSLFIYDPMVNGLRFSLGALNDTIKALETICVSGINHSADIPLIVLEKNYNLNYSLQVQKLEGKSIGTAYDTEGKLLKGSAIILDSTVKSEKISKEVETSDLKTDLEEIDESVSNDNILHPSISTSLSKEDIEAKLRPIISKEEHEKAEKEILQRFQKVLNEKEMRFMEEKKKLIYIAVGSVVCAFIIGALLFK